MILWQKSLHEFGDDILQVNTLRLFSRTTPERLVQDQFSPD